jgi:hypothetical protein
MVEDSKKSLHQRLSAPENNYPARSITVTGPGNNSTLSAGLAACGVVAMQTPSLCDKPNAHCAALGAATPLCQPRGNACAPLGDELPPSSGDLGGRDGR